MLSITKLKFMKQTKNVIQFRNGFVNLPKGEENVNYELATTVAAELLQFGYILDQGVIANIAEADKNDIVRFHNEVVEYLKEVTGSSRKYRPFWKGFPEEVMQKTEIELWIHQIVHYLSNGAYEPSEWTKQRPTAFEQPKYIKIIAGDEDKFKAIFTNLVSMNQSLTADDAEVVKYFVENKIELRMPKVIPFKETLCSVIGQMIQSGYSLEQDLPRLTVTDVLRISVYMSGGDISLPKVPAEMIKMNRWSHSKSKNPARDKFKFRKFKRSERRLIMGLLEKTNCDVKEFVLKDSRWIRLGEILHPGEFADKFPKAFEMFDDIRNTNVKSWYGEVNDAFNQSFEIGIKKLSERPGEFMRRLDNLIRNNPKNTKQILKVLGSVAMNVSNKVLYEAFSHFEKRNRPISGRTIMVKGSRKRTKLPDLPAIDDKIIADIQLTIMSSIQEKFSSLEALGKVYIDPELKKLPVPTNMRSMSTTSRPVMRGQRVPIGNQNAKVIRAYVHWFDENGNMDIDLTATFMGMGKVNHVGWNGGHNSEIGCYSGDIRHRRGACAEYIDINVKAALKAGYKYVVMDARNYNGGSFEEVPECVFGYMEREHQKENEIFVPATLANSVRLTSSASTSIVAAIDLETYEYIFLDVDADGIPVASANFDKIMDALKPYTELPSFSVYNLIQLHTNVRGTEVESPDKADLIINMDSFPSYVEIGKWMGI